VRFIQPVKVGSRIRARTRLAAVTDKGGGRWLLKSEVAVEIEGDERPALVVEALTMYFTA
jgi:acyl dehydratase